MDTHRVYTLYRQMFKMQRRMSVGVTILRKAKTKNIATAISKIKLSSLFEAFTIGEFRCLINTEMQKTVKSIPTAAVQPTAIAKPLFHCRLFSGRSTHFVLFSLGFCLSGHSVQLEEMP